MGEPISRLPLMMFALVLGFFGGIGILLQLNNLLTNEFKWLAILTLLFIVIGVFWKRMIPTSAETIFSIGGISTFIVVGASLLTIPVLLLGAYQLLSFTINLWVPLLASLILLPLEAIDFAFGKGGRSGK